jgi:hypothetical protein
LRNWKSIIGIIIIAISIASLVVGFSYNYSLGECPAPVPYGIYQNCTDNLLAIVIVIAGLVMLGIGIVILAITDKILLLKRYH